MKQALLVIDVQNDYFAGGKNELYQPDFALVQVNMLEEKFLAEGQPIIYIQHIKHWAQADFFEVGTTGAELHAGLKADEHSLVIEKHFPNSFLETELLEKLQELEVDQLVICGMMTQMCVDSTTRAARELGFQPILVGDATATKDLTFAGRRVAAENVQLAFLSSLQNFAQVVTAAKFLEGGIG
ncbi:cysteine hydrolase family protein [Lactococcus kimchii]|uniref:cysteine hydrolase family protein n=1 Tax=Lactococcus sp. S-13 TaxID=2507158 RepID=UPI001022D5B8|nr:cysteine hydrolase family protein [Lactococcus sp. S-13]RZI49214.1 cysteine hydrolase [Lactococcus sp. S-13]